MPLPPTYSASHHHVFQEAMTAVLPATIVSLPSYPSETTPLQSASHQLAFDYDPNSTAEQQCHLIYNDATSTTVNTNPHHHPTDNCFEYFFRTTIFLSVWIPNSFHSTIAIYFQHGVPIHFHHGATIVYNSKKNPNKSIANISFPTNPFPTNSNLFSFLCLIIEFPSNCQLWK